MTQLVLVAAQGRNRELGAGNQLLWHIPEDLAHFKALTLGKPVLMGRKTWESLPPRFRPLPGRRNLVLTRGGAIEGAEVVRSLDEALGLLGDAPELCIIGGAEVYALALPRAQRIELTEVDAEFPQADCHFPALGPEWLAAPADWQGQTLRWRFRSYRQN
ncbi:dihydrofolate reductase [Inhella inkyongensis]|uniref:Dihydrofolate reductase n=1 Tax=Inhella inkyongensis TaxID=392593 RepID=A0A840S7K7_9BURK|nr:dihydrofolate reductase [Inhella inkyongensis]MBB5205488.1 dihydrofolate reductase [Inhella inkyongensis]